VVFEGIEQAILSAARKHFSEEEQLEVRIDRETGEPALICDGRALEPELLGDLLGRISAQTAKQVMIQKIREAERDALYEEYLDLRSQLISGQVTRVDRGTVIVKLDKIEAILPRSEQIRKENFRTGDRVRAIVLDVRKAGSRVRVILSRTHPDFVRRLFEIEIPEVNDRVIEVRSIAREAGNRSKVAVSCADTTIDSVGACVGVRGARIRGIVDELAGERIDIVRWNDSLTVLVPNALQPAEVEDVILCPMLGKVIVLVREDQLSLAIGKFGQNVRLASKLVGWDINVMTQVQLDAQLDKSIEAFCVVPEITAELAESLVSQGFFTFDDLSVIEPEQLVEMSGLTAAECDHIVEYADKESARLEAEERFQAEQRKLGVGSTASRSGEAPVSAPVATSDIASGAGEP
jgi:N utilization substance protein A